MGGDALARRDQRALDQFHQTRTRDLSIAGLAAGFFGTDQQGAVQSPAPPGQPAQALLDGIAEMRRTLGFKAQLDRCLDLIDVLASRALGPAKLLGQFPLRNKY